MNNHLIRRRNLLFYLGLGLVGMGTATAAFPKLREVEHKNKTEIAIQNSGVIYLPEFNGISEWLNSTPLSIAKLRGNVILIQFWTFACINCQLTLPYITKWHQQYKSQGLKVIGIHTPEFAFERDINNIKRALKQHQINYPVPVDNEYKTWNAYNNQYWPHLFLADRQGVIRYDHIGEGAYDRTEETIRQLLR